MVLASDAKVYKSEQVEAWWDVPVYADHQEVRANQVDARVVNHVSKKVMTIEKYGPCLLYTSPSPRDLSTSRMPSSA